MEKRFGMHSEQTRIDLAKRRDELEKESICVNCHEYMWWSRSLNRFVCDDCEGRGVDK
jgi:hypothetical protein